ncbi:oxidoreductase [Nonomuraea turkmeniaca]|uniref:Oxidoreductase n=1 Tax=Nonomuraea turkmeniaca TaxID=103838 RepID=A0A5S4F838_9ACTN|nr:acyl-CoA dehydrogenase family protein [Nonomuraea turkmeniaca]TMR12776.1 oxidoreductase [Nonomuraea turkmeniaca]
MNPAAPHVPERESEFLSETGRRIRDEIRDLIPVLRANAAEGERIGALTPETLKAVSDVGVFKLTLPAEYGGTALGARDITEIVTALGSGDAAVGWLAIVATATRMSLAYPERTVEEVFRDARTWDGPIIIGASLLSPVVGKARKVDGGWMISGKWTFGSGSRHAAWATVGVEYTSEDGGRRRAMALMPRDEFRILDDWHVMGLMGTSSNSITTLDEEGFVPEHRVFDMADVPRMVDTLRGRYDGLGFKLGTFGSMLLTPTIFAALALGMAEGCLECFTEQARHRKPFNLPYPTVADMPSVQVTAGKARAAINVARATIHQYADELDRRALRDEDFTPFDEPKITMDLVFTIHMLAQAIDALQLALGSSTVDLANPIQRFVREIRVLATHGALRLDPMAEINGREILGTEPFMKMSGFEPPAGR